jgi:hypothetical protein
LQPSYVTPSHPHHACWLQSWEHGGWATQVPRLAQEPLELTVVWQLKPLAQISLAFPSGFGSQRQGPAWATVTPIFWAAHELR